MNRLAGETACPTHRQVVWISFSLSRAVVENGPDKLTRRCEKSPGQVGNLPHGTGKLLLRPPYLTRMRIRSVSLRPFLVKLASA